MLSRNEKQKQHKTDARDHYRETLLRPTGAIVRITPTTWITNKSLAAEVRITM